MRALAKFLQTSKMAKNWNPTGAPCSNSTRHFEAPEHSALYAKARPEPPESLMQALHWTSPNPLFAQVGLALRPGGSFAIIGYDFSRPHPDHPQASDLTAAMFS